MLVPTKYDIDPQHRLTAIDYGDVCVNVDHRWFAAKHLAEPTTFEDLAKPEYKDLLVVESPETSSPGLAFLLGTIAHFGDDHWQDYWKSLRDNGVKVDGAGPTPTPSTSPVPPARAPIRLSSPTPHRRRTR